MYSKKKSSGYLSPAIKPAKLYKPRRIFNNIPPSRTQIFFKFTVTMFSILV